MTSTTALNGRNPHGSPDRIKTAIAAAVGTSVENYDFIAYGTASALYFGKAFFPGEDPVVGTILAFATLAVGFLMRPIGGSIGGYLGDRFDLHTGDSSKASATYRDMTIALVELQPYPFSSRPIAACASEVEPATCGVRITFGNPWSGVLNPVPFDSGSSG